VSHDPWPGISALQARGIQSVDEYHEAFARLDQLMGDDDMDPLDPAFTAELNALVKAIEAYEESWTSLSKGAGT
jgi:uncharacterized protein Yka (UPF0111/DUF47 family)